MRPLGPPVGVERIILVVETVLQSKYQANTWGFFLSLRGCGSPEPTVHQSADGCHTGDLAVQHMTNGSHFSGGEGEAQRCLNCPCKRDIKGNGMEKKEMISGKITTCPEGIAQNWNCLGIRGGKTTQQLILSWSISRVTLTGCWSLAPALEFVLELTDFYSQQKEGKFEEERGVRFLSMGTEHISGQECRHVNHMGPFTGVYKCQSHKP